jgi:glutamate formiminotransferase
VNLDTGDLAVARRIARAIRASNGGLDAVKAIGVATTRPDVVQVSINLVDFERTPLYRVFEAVRQAAAGHGIEVLNSEIVGLVPAAALLPAAAHALRIDDFTMQRVLDRRIPPRDASPPPGTTAAT